MAVLIMKPRLPALPQRPHPPARACASEHRRVKNIKVACYRPCTAGSQAPTPRTAIPCPTAGGVLPVEALR